MRSWVSIPFGLVQDSHEPLVEWGTVPLPVSDFVETKAQELIRLDEGEQSVKVKATKSF